MKKNNTEKSIKIEKRSKDIFESKYKPIKGVKKKSLFFTLLTSMSLILSSGYIELANGAQNNISLDFAASEPSTYSHTTGGGSWNGGIINSDIVRSLESKSFVCGDYVSLLTKVEVPATEYYKQLGGMTMNFNYSFTMDTTGQSGLSFSDPLLSRINSDNDQASINDGGSVLNQKSLKKTGTEYSKGSQLLTTYTLTDVEAGETFVLPISTKINCQENSNPTGNLQAKFLGGFLTQINGDTSLSPTENLGLGSKTVDLKVTQQTTIPTMSLTKTVTKGENSCPGEKSIIIKPDETVKYCYYLTNNSINLSENIYNLSDVLDDGGQYEDFIVNLTTGLTDLDGDGLTDDLAPGSTAQGEYLKSFDGDQDSTITNIATVTGSSLSMGGTIITATDTAIVNVDAPPPAPSIKISKTPKSQIVKEGESAYFTIVVTNNGDVDLENISVEDPNSTNCNKLFTNIKAGESETYTCQSGSVIEPFQNVARASGMYNGVTVTSVDIANINVDYLPKIYTEKSASVSSVLETGGEVTYTIKVYNKGNENFTLTSLVDDKFGDISARCSLPVEIPVEDTYQCEFSEIISSDDLTQHKNIVTTEGHDPENNIVSANATTSVSFIDILPSLTLKKSVTPDNVKWSGGDVIYKFVITNNSLERVKIINFSDALITLSAECQSIVNSWLEGKASIECETLYHINGGGMGGDLINNALLEGEDNEGNKTESHDSATLFVELANPVIEITKSPENQVVKEGSDAEFTIKISNIGNVHLSDILVSDLLTPDCNKVITLLLAGEVETYTCKTLKPNEPFTNVINVSANFMDINVDDQDSANINIDYLPKVEISKLPTKNFLPETGEMDKFSIEIKNIGRDKVTITSLTDDIFGNLNGAQYSTCILPVAIEVGESYQCSFEMFLNSDTLSPHENTVTVKVNDPEGNTLEEKARAKVDFYDILPSLSISKTSDKSTAKWSGEYINYKITITNTSKEPLQITYLTDSKVEISENCKQLLNTWMPSLESVECIIKDLYAIPDQEGKYINTINVKAKDNENNEISGSSTNKVIFWWYGRTPGYWKNHQSAWTGIYLPATKIQEVFSIPNNYLTNSLLDLDKNSTQDTLLDGLGYKGGSTVTGAAQILLRAAISALLNENYYGADYPAESIATLKVAVNNTLASQNREAIIKLARTLDYWNNGNESSL